MLSASEALRYMRILLSAFSSVRLLKIMLRITVRGTITQITNELDLTPLYVMKQTIKHTPLAARSTSHPKLDLLAITVDVSSVVQS